MSGKTTTYTIHFKAQYDSLSKLEAELARIQKQSANLDLTKKEQERVQGLIAKIQQLQQTITQNSKGDYVLDVKQFKAIEKEFASIIAGANSFSQALIKMVPQEAKEQIKQLESQIASLNTKSRELGLQKSVATRKFNKQANAATIETIQQAGPMADVTDSSGKAITSYTALKQRADELSQVNRELTAQEQQLMQLWSQVETKVQPFLKEYTNTWNVANQGIQQNRIAVDQLNQKIVEVTNNSAKTMPLQWDSNAKAIYTDFTGTVKDLGNNIAQTTDQVQEHDKAVVTGTKIQHTHTQQVRQVTQAYDKNRTTLGKAVHNVISYGTVLRVLRTMYNKLITTIKEMDKALTGMTVVTSLTREQAWKLVGTLQDLATQTGTTTTEIANMTTMYLQQGKTLSDALELTEAAAKAARIAGISGSESINLLTNAMNGFQVKASQAMEVSDKFAALAASAATDYEELATALSKVAAQANLAGMSMDFTLGMLTKGIEVTREAPETIGTALKTIIARMRELTDYGETLEDGVDVNRVDKALDNIGVKLLDSNREFRDLEDVLSEVGEKWDTLNINQQANVAIALAGTRQQSRLIAMMQDFNRTQELVNISMKSAGATAAQHAKYMEGLEAAVSNLTTSYQRLITSISNSDFAVGFINRLTTAFNGLANNVEVFASTLAALAIVYGHFMLLKKKDASLTIFSYLTEKTRNAVSMVFLLMRKRELRLTRECIEANMKDAQSNIECAKTESFRTASIARLNKLRKQQRLNTAQNIVLEGKLNAVMSSNPYVLITAIIIGLIAAWYQLNKETEAGIRLQEAIQNLMKALGDIISALLAILMPIVELLIDLIGTLMPVLIAFIQISTIDLQVLAEVLKVLAAALEAVVEWFTKLYKQFMNSKLVKGIVSGFNKATKAIRGWVKGIKSWFGGTASESKKLAADIAKNQKKIYENQQLTGTLTPLIDEYEALRQKANKTTEDIERMSEIESQIGDLDEDYKTKSGSIDWDEVKKENQEKSFETARLIQENYEKALKGINTGKIANEFRSGISDKFAADIAEYAKVTDGYSTATATAIAKNFEITMATMSDEEIKAIGKVEGGFDKLYESVKSFEEAQADSEGTLTDNIIAFQTQYNKLLRESSKEAANAFATTYAAYKNYYDLLNNLDATGQKNVLSNLTALGMSAEDYNTIKKAYQERLTFSAQGEDESDEDYAKRRQAEQAKYDAKFNKYLTKYLSGNVSSRTDLITALISDRSITDDVRSALLNSLTLTNQAALENYTKSTSRISNLEELSKKAAAGTITMEELRQAVMDSPELFNSEEKMNAFMQGKISIAELKQQAKATLQDELDAREAAIKQEIEHGNLTESALENYQAELQLITQQREMLKYAELYSSEIWKNAEGITNEIVRQKRFQSDLNKLTKEYKNLTDPSKRASNLRQQLAIYRAMEYNAQSILGNANYTNAVNAGYIIDGEVVATQEQLLAIGEGTMWKWLEANKDAIKEAYDNNETALEGYRSIIEEDYNNKKEFLEKQKEQYQDYWDRLDAFEEEQEREQSRQDVVRQLAALAGGSDAATNSLRKDLLSQLADLEQEEAEARKQAVRDALIDSIDKHITNIDDEVSELVTLTKDQVFGKLTSMGYDVAGYTVTYAGSDSKGTQDETHGVVRDRNGNVIYAFKQGGLVDYTGPAWVDGTKSNPEAFLDAQDTKLISALVAALSYGNLSGILTGDASDLSNIVIENINISTGQLNTGQDFRKSGQIFAEEFAKAIRQRGVNVNVKR